MLLHFIRHGQTDFNIGRRLQGVGIDEPLNETGEKQIAELVPRLPKDFGVIFSSPLKRTLMSAEMIARATEKAIVIRSEVAERDFGSLAGKTWEEIPDGAQLRERDRLLQYDYRPYGGECVQDVEKRLKQFLGYAKGTGYAAAIAVSSMGVIRLAYKLLRNEHVTEIRNASVHSFTW
jgi:broad specificity phosphatase PhoE